MKKFFRGLIITLVVLIILPIALVFIFLFDTGKMKVTYDDNFQMEKWSQALVVDSLDNTETQKKAKFTVTEADINNMLYSGIKDNTQIQKYLTQFAIDIQEDAYTLNVSGKFYFFETRAKLTAKLSKDEIDGKNAFILSVDKMSVGRLTQLKPIVMFFLNRFLTDDTLDALTANIKLHTDLANSRLYIYTEDLRDMINQGIGGGSGTSDFYFAFINDFLDMNLVTFDFYGGDSLTVDVNLEPLTGNDYDASAGDNVYYPMHYEDTTTKLTINGEQKQLSLNVIREAVTYLMNEGEITPANVAPVSSYLFEGANGSNVPSCDLSKIGVLAPDTYPGFALVPASSIDDMLKNAVSSFDSYSTDLSINSFNIASLKESDINLFLKSQSCFGMKYFLSREVSEGDYKVNYIALDNAYMNIYGNDAIISIGLNINGLETIITLKMVIDPENHDTSKLVYKADKVYFGKESENLAISNDTKDVIFEALAEAVNQSSFKFDRQGKMTISFDALVTTAANSVDTSTPIGLAYKSFLQNSADFSVEVDGNAVTDNSSIKIVASRH
ncbi:MAG: hypothetical protein IK028_01100 [Bacilli bacterium]|nr:hypothetical protein [Bacilli bacterium]